MEGPFFLPFCYTNSILTNKNNRISPVFVGIPIEKGQNPLYNKAYRKGGKRMENNHKEYLECERHWVFALLIFVGGFYGVYTYLLRGGVFCNAQSANFVLFAIELGNFHWSKAAYYLIPMTAYMAGAFVSEAVSIKLTRVKFLRWETVLVAIEILFIIVLGFIPDSAPFQISQIAINFICSMQYNTFRQAEGIPMATTFCTNHVRQVGIHLHYFLTKRDLTFLKRSLRHLGMLGMFVLGGVIGVFTCRWMGGKAIWGTAVPMLVLFISLLRADLTVEKERLHTLPHGH